MKNSLCSQCGERETLTHLFVDCCFVKEKCKILENYVYISINLKIGLERAEILLGYCFQNQNRVPINTLLLVTKKYIFDTSHKNQIFNSETLKHRLDQMYLEEKYVAILSDRQKLFHQVWEKWQSVFCIQK